MAHPWKQTVSDMARFAVVALDWQWLAWQKWAKK
jgi:hypothetical protein